MPYNSCINNKCRHNSISKITLYEIFGLFSIFLAAALSNAGGIGGGTLFIPVLLLIMNFYTHEAVPISKIVIFAGSLAAFFMNLKLKHPYRNCKALNFNLVIILCPNLLLGTIFGVTLNMILPNAIIVGLLCLLMFFNTYKTLKMGFKQYENESQNLKYLIKVNTDDNNVPVDNDNIMMPEILAEINKDNTILRLDKLVFVIVPFVIMICLSVYRESNVVEKCSLTYWFLLLIFIVFAVIFDIFAYKHIQKEYNFRKSINFPYQEQELILTERTSIKMGIIGLISGFIAGTIGIGGGVVLGPILLSENILPIVSTVTTNFLVLFTSSSTSIQFMLAGVMNYQYAILCVIFSVLGSLLGTYFIQKFLKQSGRQSVLIFALSAVVGISAIVLPLSSIKSAWIDIQDGKDIFKFNSPC